MMTNSLVPETLHPPTQIKTPEILAAIDVGTNSVHMVVVRIDPKLPAFTIVTREKATVRLGDRDPKNGHLKPEIMERAIAAFRRFLQIARSLNAQDVIAVATSAVREAPNGRDFIQQIKSEIGLEVNLISGAEEARRIYLGVLSAMDFQGKPHAIIDIGGGSTELILGDGRAARSLSSTKVGAVRLTTELVTTDPISNSELNYLKAYIRGRLERAVEELQSYLKPGEKPRLVGTSGTIETLACIDAWERLGAEPTTRTGYELKLENLQHIIKKLCKLSESDRASIPGMSEKRSEIIIAGALILQEAMLLLNMNSLTICGRALREGIIVDWMLARGLIVDKLQYQSQVRDRSVLKVADKYHVDLEYSRRTANFAACLFDKTQGILHHWGAQERDLLYVAALLHNCGVYISHAAHHKHSYYLIRHGELLGYTENEIEIIANLARYHRKSVPKKKHESYMNLMSKTDRKLVDQLSPLLRLSVALDRRQIGAVRSVNCHYNDANKQLYLTLTPALEGDDCELEQWSVDDKKQAFESEYGIKLRVGLA